MSTYEIDLYVCISALVLWIFVAIFYGIRIAKSKKNCSNENVRAGGKFMASVVCSFLLIVLPYLVPFEVLPTVVLEGCGVMGLLVIMHDRLSEVVEASGEEKSEESKKNKKNV